MKEYPYLSRFILGGLQLILSVLAFEYYENLTAVLIIFTYPTLLLLIQNWKNDIKDQGKQKDKLKGDQNE